MARKVEAVFFAKLEKNITKGGAWLGIIQVTHIGVDSPIKTEVAAFSNASAGKRWVKERVTALTPRKSIKLIDTGDRDEKNKPIKFMNELKYKAEA